MSEYINNYFHSPPELTLTIINDIMIVHHRGVQMVNGVSAELENELKEWLARIIISQSTIEKFTTIRAIEKEIMLDDKPITLKLEWTVRENDDLYLLPH